MEKKTRYWIASVFLSFSVAQAASEFSASEFSASVDRNQISIDETLNLKLEVRSEGTDSAESIDFQAPDFDVINEYQSNFVQSYYENGSIGTRNILQINKILKPRKTGALEIRDLRAVVETQTVKAPSILVQVSESNVHTGPAPQSPARGAVGSGIRGQARPSGDSGFFVRAEANKEKVYKGEQIIVSYSIYHRVRVNNLQVEKYPTLDGFLREDLDMPVLHQLTSERTIVGGTIYNRALLVKYAAYPLKEGTLAVDPMGVKLAYFGQQGFSGDEDDIFGSFQNFFQQMAPRMGTSRSEIIKIQVVPLPEEGRPAHFTGAVGDFTVSAQADKATVKAGEAVTLKLRVEGRGNLSGVEVPKIDWPQGVEQYESKGVAKTQKSGVSEKVFDVVIISKNQGKLEIPAIAMGFFDPEKKQYVQKQSSPFTLMVEGQLENTAKNSPPQNFEVKKQEESSFAGDAGSKWILVGSLGGIAAVLFLAGRILRRRRPDEFEDADTETQILKPITRAEKSWATLTRIADDVRRNKSTPALVNGYEMLTGAVYDLLDKEYSIGARSRSRNEMAEYLRVEKGISGQLWNRINKLLEYAEIVRFALSSGIVAEEDARAKLSEWIEEARQIEQELKKREPWQNPKRP